MTSEIKDSMLIDDGKTEMLEDEVECGGQTICEIWESTIFECGNLRVEDDSN